MPAPATQPAPSPRRFDRNLILARERALCVGRVQSLRAILEHERHKAVRSAWYEQHIRLELLSAERRESRIDYDHACARGRAKRAKARELKLAERAS